jgi:hypothetical protein
MELKFAIVCNNAFTDNSGKLNIIQAFDTINSANFPAVHPKMFVVTKYLLMDNEKGQLYEQIIKIMNEQDGTLVAESKVEIPSLPNDMQFIQIISPFDNIVLKNEGIYKINVIVNEIETSPAQFLVKKTIDG